MWVKVINKLILIGLIMAIPFVGACAQRDPRLKDATHYFANPQTVALLQAALVGDLAKAKGLVASGGNPNDEGPMTNSNATRLRLLHYAIADHNTRGVQTLVAVGADPEIPAQNNGNAFAFAIKIGKPEMLALLLELRPVETLSEKTREYLMFNSVEAHCQSCLELVLRKGVPIDVRDSAGYTPFMHALSTGPTMHPITEWLLQAGAAVLVESRAGVTPAYQVQHQMERIRPELPEYAQLQRIKDLMIAKGAVFPALAPAEVKARRATGAK